MIETIESVLYFLAVAALIGSVVYSFKFRRAADPRVRGLNMSKMNIFMGLLLVILAIIQMFMFSGSTLRVIIGAVFMVIGLFNIFAGIRNHSHYKRIKA
ncbi:MULTISPECIES: YtpI family protein [unclassified Paenibacillus]|uniref:YtpI family protein n=1 Tax=unclassified Paenibacillus TaxID=185978 RepID=UPI001C12000B|nr:MULTISPECIES: YtpI family protein [unclassified Paenibacillus]MBU5441575.1 YtpI family protein [Paenibacillus sp. MSJ-34]CAH0117755.1 hypothetical protein PAE9249_00216 [Paenibacillus sp. CECT 9249]